MGRFIFRVRPIWIEYWIPWEAWYKLVPFGSLRCSTKSRYEFVLPTALDLGSISKSRSDNIYDDKSKPRRMPRGSSFFCFEKLLCGQISNLRTGKSFPSSLESNVFHLLPYKCIMEFADDISIPPFDTMLLFHLSIEEETRDHARTRLQECESPHWIDTRSNTYKRYWSSFLLKDEHSH